MEVVSIEEISVFDPPWMTCNMARLAKGLVQLSYYPKTLRAHNHFQAFRSKGHNIYEAFGLF